MTRAEDNHSSAGGARVATGVSFQAEVFAWWATLSVAGCAVGMGIENRANVAAVGSETGLGVDDVGVTLSDGGFVLLQAKSGVRRLTLDAPDLRKAIEQVVRVYEGGIPMGDRRPIDPSRDRLAIAVDHKSSGSFKLLSRVCGRLRSHPIELPSESAAVNNAERIALAAFIEAIRATWASKMGTPPTEAEVRALLRVVEVQCFDFSEFGVDRTRANAMLVQATVPDAFNRLCAVGLSCAKDRSWRSRSDLATLVGMPSTATSDIRGLATVLQQRSDARRSVRLQAFDIDSTALAPHLNGIAAIEVPAGKVVVLSGDFGSGKSEIAETWHREGIKTLLARDDAPFPVWLSARDLHGQSLEAAVEHQLARNWREGQGASITIDGVDEITPATAEGVLEAARTLVRTYSNVAVLLTARPGTVVPGPAEEVAPALLSEDEALRLVELAGGQAHHTWRWTADMRASVTRPFFALAAGAMLGRDQAPKGRADLIRGLVEDALAKGTERSAVTSAETRTVLQTLAVNLTQTSRDGLSFSNRQIALSSRLVAEGSGRSVLFSLPIFQHWFAAQAILGSDVPAAEIVADAHSFNRWQWAAAVAASSAPDVETLDSLLQEWVTGNPGAAAWIVGEAFSGHRDWRSEHDESLDSKTSGLRLLRAIRSWADSLGPMARFVLPLPAGPVRLGVAVSGHRLDVALSPSSADFDEVTHIAPTVHPLSSPPVPDWRLWFSGAPPQGDAWPWLVVRRTIAKATQDMLSSEPFLGAPEGVWVQERRYDLSRRLLGRRSLLHSDLPATEVKTQAAEILNLVGAGQDAKFSLEDTKYSSAELEDLISWIDSAASEHVRWHLPVADLNQTTSQWIWDLYSTPRLMELEAEVYGRACKAYDEALAHSFARFGWSMSGAAFAPFGVVLELSRAGADELKNIPVLTVLRVPTEIMANFATAGTEDAAWSSCGRAVIRRLEQEDVQERQRHLDALERAHAWTVEQNREPIFGLTYALTGADDMVKTRPASNVAANWLWEDLKHIGLAEGFSPELR